jgi:hypothetical protein
LVLKHLIFLPLFKRFGLFWYSSEGLNKGIPGTFGNLIPHQNPNPVNLLPFSLKGKERADFEVARSDVDDLGNLAPVMQIAQDLPVVIAVIDYKKFTARWTGSIRHRVFAF